MTTKEAWHPKAIDPKARRAAEAAAKDASMPVDQWVEAAIRRHTGCGDAPIQPQPRRPALILERRAQEARPEKTFAKSGDTRYAAPPPHPFRRKLRWLAAGSLVFLIFLVAAFGLLWISENKVPSSQIASIEGTAKKLGNLSSASLEHIRAAAKTGKREAQFDLAMRYTEGEWVPKDDLAAADWFEKAALQGHAAAQYRLGLSYEAGLGVTQNLFEAFFWFQSAAEQGHLHAKFKIAAAYAEGIGIGPDLEKAATLFSEAAEQGHVEAMRRLAGLYEQGKGLARDPEAARLWRAAAEEVAALDTPAKKDVQIVILRKAAAPGKPEAADLAETIQTIEWLLVRLGFEPGTADGRVTDETETAIRLYQSFADLPVDGKPSQALLEELRAVSETAGMEAE